MSNKYVPGKSGGGGDKGQTTMCAKPRVVEPTAQDALPGNDMQRYNEKRANPAPPSLQSRTRTVLIHKTPEMVLVKDCAGGAAG